MSELINTTVFHNSAGLIQGTKRSKEGLDAKQNESIYLASAFPNYIISGRITSHFRNNSEEQHLK